MKKIKTNEDRDSAIAALRRQYEADAKRHGETFTLSFDVFKRLILSNCHYCGATSGESLRTLAQNGNFFYRNTISKLVPTEGYTESNTAPSCLVCKTRLGISDSLEFLRWVQVVAKNTANYPKLLDEEWEHRKSQANLRLAKTQAEYVKRKIDEKYSHNWEYTVGDRESSRWRSENGYEDEDY